jgi:hypothetical protein
MNERKMERAFLELFEDIASDDELQASLDQPALANAQVKTFEDAGLLTRDRGIVLTLEDGSEFQVTIVQSAKAENEDSDEDEEAN